MVLISKKMASGYGLDDVEVAETSFKMKPDKHKGVKEGSAEEDGMKHHFIHFCIMSIVFLPFEV
jgi:hypothetical protein